MKSTKHHLYLQISMKKRKQVPRRQITDDDEHVVSKPASRQSGECGPPTLPLRHTFTLVWRQDRSPGLAYSDRPTTGDKKNFWTFLADTD